MRQVLACLLLATLSHAVELYLNPSRSLPSNLSPSDASFVISQHLGLDAFEPLANIRGNDLIDDNNFIGKGPKNGLLLSLTEADAKGMLM